MNSEIGRLQNEVLNEVLYVYVNTNLFYNQTISIRSWKERNYIPKNNVFWHKLLAPSIYGILHDPKA